MHLFDSDSRLPRRPRGAPARSHAWRVANQRRLELIRKRSDGGLAEAEEEELRGLQELADRQVEELDSRMLEHLAKMEATVRQVIDHEPRSNDQ